MFQFMGRPGLKQPGYATTPAKAGLKSIILFGLLFALPLVACGNDGGATATPEPLNTPIILPTEAGELLPPAVVTDTPAGVVATGVAATVTTPAEATVTVTGDVVGQPAETPTATALPTDTDSVIPGGGVAGSLAAGEIRAYRYNAPAAFEPVMVLIEPAGEEDLLLRAYDQPVDSATVGQLTPLGEWNIATAGNREIAVFTPQEEGDYYLAVVEATGTAAVYQMYLFDKASTAPPVVLNESNTLAAGENRAYTVPSATSRAIAVFIEPAGEQTDLALRVQNPDGAVINEGNFSGAGSAETIFFLPRADTDYRVIVSEAAGAAGGYTILIIRLD